MKSNIASIYRAIEFIEKHIKTSINMDTLASHVGFSKYHFIRLFKECTGYSPYDYYRGRKVTKAIHYMLKNNCKIIDAAFEYGFNSPEVFTRSCLSAFDQSPSQIKKSIQENSFKGITTITYEILEAYQLYKSIEIKISLLPATVIKGFIYTSNDVVFSMDWNKEVIRQMIESSETNTLYHLLWKKDVKDTNYTHLIGVITDFTEKSDVFSNYVYKHIPTCQYLSFPRIQQGNPLNMMREYIYDYYFAKNNNITTLPYEIEGIRLDKVTLDPIESILYVPVLK